jgi:hypothetical protein
MSDPLRSIDDYELFIYTLAEQFPIVRRSTVVIVRRGATLARVEGEIHFEQGIHLIVRERLLFDRQPGVIDSYGYEVWKQDEKLYWYDSQPHPTEASLQTNHPHHKHIPPDIKHNRVPALNMSFTRSNLPYLIGEIEDILTVGN